MKKVEAAEVLQVSERTINRWVAQKKLKAIRLGNIFRIDPEELERFKRKYAA
jgi:excisionase family DNA binding protein